MRTSRPEQKMHRAILSLAAAAKTTEARLWWCSDRGSSCRRARRRTCAGRAAPHAEEIISYRMPAFRGHGILVYFAAFKSHVGVFPPIEGDAALDAALAPYRGPKGNLRFPLAAPIPYDLIARLVQLRVAQDQAKAAGPKRRKGSRAYGAGSMATTELVLPMNLTPFRWSAG